MRDIGDLIVRLVLEGKQYRDELKKNVAETHVAAKAMTTAHSQASDDMQSEAGKLIAKLKEQNATFGMSAAELRRYKAAQVEMTQAQRDASDALLKNLETMEARGAGGLARLSAGATVFSAGLGLVAVAAIAAGVAYHQAQKENEAYQRSIILTGNAAGVTAGQLSDMARRIDGVAGTHAQAAATLAQMTGTAQVARGNLEKVSLAAIEMERASVQSIGESVKVFADLGKAPVAASLRLNESMNYLTASTFEQIKAAEQMGRAEEAASIAQNAYADAARERTAKVEESLNSLGRFMRGVRSIAAEMWDAILNVGRDKGPGALIEAQEKTVAALESQLARGGTATGGIQRQLDAARQRLQTLQEEAKASTAAAEAERQKQAAENAGIALSAEASKHDSALEKQRKAVAQATAHYTSAIQREGLTQQERAQIDANYLKIVTSLTQEKEKAAKPRGARKDAGGDPYAAERAGAQEWAKVMATAGKAVETLEGKTQGLNAAQQALLGYLGSPAYAQNTEDMRQAALTRLYAWDAAIKHADATKAEAEAVASASKAMATWQDASAKETQGLKAQVAARKEEAAALGLSAVEVAGLTAAKHEQAAAEKEAYAAALESAQLYAGEYSEAYATAAEAAREQARLLRELAGSEVSTAGRRAMLDEWKQTVDKYDDVFRTGFADMLNSGKDGWKSFTKSLATTFKTTVADQLYKAFAQPFVVSVVGNLLGLAGSAGLSSAGQAAAGGGAGGVMGLLNAGSSIYSALTKGIGGSISTAFGNFAASGVGQSLGLSSMGAGGMGPPALTSMGSTVGAGLGMLGSGFAGYGLSKMISGGYTTGGNTVNALAGVASAFLGPLAGVAGGLINRAFGRKLKDVGIEGTLGGADGFEGQAYQFYKGGWLRSDKTKYRELDADTAGVLSQSFKAIQAEVGTFATALGLETDKIASFTTSFKVSTKGLDEAGIQQAFQEALAKGSNELAQQVLGTWTTVTREATETIRSGHWDTDYITEDVTRTITESTYAASEYAKEGEEAIDTLRRLATSLTTVNDIWKNLGADVYDASLAGADAASRMVDAFGGLEAMVAATSTYYDNFYSEDERKQNAKQRLNERLTELGVDIDLDAPDARARYRALVDDRLAQAKGQAKAREELATSFTQLIAGGTADIGKLDIGSMVRSAVGDGSAASDQDVEKIRAGLAAIDTAGMSLDTLKGSVSELLKPIVGTGKGAEEAAAELIELSGVFAGVTDSAQDAAQDAAQAAAQAVQSATDATDAAWAALQRSVSAARDAAQAEIELREQRLASAQAVVDLAREQSRDLRGLVDSTVGQTAAQASAWIDSAVAAARTGALPDADLLGRAVEDARAGMDASAYSNRLDYEAAQLILANKLDVIGDAGAAQVDVNQLLLEQARAEVDRLDALIKSARDALDAQRGNTIAVQGVEAAVREFYDRMFADEDAAKATPGGSTAPNWSMGGGAPIGSGGGGPSKGERIRDVFKDADLANLQDVAQTAWILGWSRDDIAAAYKVDSGDLQRMFADQGIAFARGGTHLGGVRLVGEEGPELEVTGPSRIFSAGQTRQMLEGLSGGGGDGATLAALRQLTQQQYDLLRAVIVRLDSIDNIARKQDALGVKQRAAA